MPSHCSFNGPHVLASTTRARCSERVVLSGTLCMISVLVVGFVNVCDTRAFITCQYFGTCEVGSSSCWFMTLPHAYSMINPRSQVLLYVPYYLLGDRNKSNQKNRSKVGILACIMSLNCHVIGIPPRSDTTWVIFQGNDALKWVDTCLGGQLNEPKQMSTEHRHRQG